ncbi:probable glycosyltransferase At5g03795 isoform X2 [Nymphaea colorata]|nr:probable glycosyltransferase At5g03795 isoform X2 [Nymphaea colorata]
MRRRDHDQSTTEVHLFHSSMKASSPQPLTNVITSNSETAAEAASMQSAKKRRKASNLEKLEAALAKARTAIREVALHRNQTSIRDGDYTPKGRIYWNPFAFHRSYIEMEKTFKIYVYEEGEPSLVHIGPCKGMYSSEGLFIDWMDNGNSFRTNDPEEAHAFFLPFSVYQMVHHIYVPLTYNVSSLKLVVADYINVISRKHGYWERNLGKDHFMLSCHDWGPLTSQATPLLYNNSIRVLCNANTSEGFKPAKDATLPEINLQSGEISGTLGGPPPSERPTLAFFAGGVHGSIRRILLEHWKDKDPEVLVYEYLPKNLSYYDLMRKSRFCLCPSGYEVASPRIVEAIYTECVPVVISKHYVLPFSDVLDWSSFSVKLPVSEIGNLKKILMGISYNRYLTMQRRVKLVQRHFVINRPPRRYDVFHMVVHSIWLRRLNQRPHISLHKEDTGSGV